MGQGDHCAGDAGLLRSVGDESGPVLWWGAGLLGSWGQPEQRHVGQ